MYKVAIMDDNQIVLDSILKTIDWESLDCTVCCTADNGIDGRAKILSHCPDIVITDIMMPGFDGLELTRLIKQEMPGIKFILITGYSSMDFARQSIRLGVFDYIPKPIDNEELMKVIREAIQKIEEERKEKQGVLPDAAQPQDQVLAFIEGVKNNRKNYSALVQQVLDYIEKNLYSDLSLKKTADEFFISPSYLSSLFKKDTGQSFISYVTMSKLNQAKLLLANPRYKVYEVGNMVGYKDYSYFYQVFKKYYGYAPGKAPE